MRHLKAGRKLNRNASHRLALMRNLSLALFRHERIITTVAKAKALRPFVEKLITLAKKNTLHARRLIISRLGTPSMAEVRPAEGNDEEGDPTRILTKLFDDIAPRFADRPGGYTRILKRSERRLGDAAPTAFIELLRAGEVKVRKEKAAPAPAPRIETPAPAPEPEAPKPEASATPPAAETPPAPPTS